MTDVRWADAATAGPEDHKRGMLLHAFRKMHIGLIGGLVLLSLGCGAQQTEVPTPATTGAGEANSYVEGLGVQHEIMRTAFHVPDNQSVRYSTNPPTSGDHWAAAQTCGFYEDGLPDERITHNLEHSNIVVSYNLPAEADVDALRSAVTEIGLANGWGITRFYSDIEPGTVALAAWGVLDTMQGVDQNRITEFFEAYAGALGPEVIPCSGS